VGEEAFEYRRRVTQALVDALGRDESVEGIIEGGAVARGRADEYSDVDLMVVAPLAQAEALFARTEAALAAIAPVAHEWRVDPPGFPDLAQRFYFLAGAPRYFAVDCSVVSPAGIVAFLERERHGEAIVWLDRKGTLGPRAVDAAALARRRQHRLAQLRGLVPVYSMLVEKELARGHPLEALGFYQVLVRALIDVLGIQHRPDRFDFGWRYVERELPAAAQQLIARHAFVPDASALAARLTSLVQTIELQLGSLPGSAASATDPAGRPSP
jgi:predicted nucleotidyltransferase